MQPCRTPRITGNQYPISSMYTETIMRKVEADGELTSFNAVKMHRKEVKELRYADVTLLFAQKPEGLHRLLQSVKTHSESSGLYLNAKKTKIMDLDKSPTFFLLQSMAARLGPSQRPTRKR